MNTWTRVGCRLTFPNLLSDLISKSLEPALNRISTFDLATLHLLLIFVP